jgi:hypothetical protein
MVVIDGFWTTIMTKRALSSLPTFTERETSTIPKLDKNTEKSR